MTRTTKNMQTGTGNDETPAMRIDGTIDYFHGGVLDPATRTVVGAGLHLHRTFSIDDGEEYRVGTNKDRSDFHIREVVQAWMSGDAFVVLNKGGTAFLHVSNLEGGTLWHVDGETQIVGHPGNVNNRRSVNLDDGDFLQIQGNPRALTSQQVWFRFGIPDEAMPQIPEKKDTGTLGFRIERDNRTSVELILAAHEWDILTALCARYVVDVPGFGLLRAQTDEEIAKMSVLSPAVSAHQDRHARGAPLTRATAADRIKKIREKITETVDEDPADESDRGGLTVNELLMRWCIDNGVNSYLSQPLAQQMLDSLRRERDDE